VSPGSSWFTFELDAENFYVTSEYSIMREQRANKSEQTTILRFTDSVGGSSIVPVSQFDLAGDVLIYVDNEASVGWVKTDGSDCGLFVEKFGKPGSSPEVALDESHVYIVSKDNVLLRASRKTFGL
jgi:hypothetical protein